MFGRKKRKPLRQLITHKEPKSRITEQYRNIRTNIEFTSVDNHVRSIIVTSADPGDGKTTTIANLAVVFGQQGKKVLLIGADLRKPTIQNLFAVHSSNGLTNLLSGQAYSMYDLVIFDMPPILAVTDAQIMANVCDASILVVRSESTEKETAVKAKGLLESAKGKLLGVVLNDREREQGLYYYYGAN
ncbi:Chromosome partitioning ATPase, Mrp family, contains Fe-S cluster [Bacillus sp. YF23]|uniref:CpsD/CapB family tyrosine-protein kinase n=1 Tax=Bacillus sp. YF23 TaxID=691698 RepID=UPI000BF8939D|nr:CpsD/CapB family tyrosine-protein kinase [Bacillus sp. YF23]PFG78111.1 Chromosome partitioning ATPase, Mrp family, contains Fe-S cluster [Bacillus sp. YF23]